MSKPPPKQAEIIEPPRPGGRREPAPLDFMVVKKLQPSDREPESAAPPPPSSAAAIREKRKRGAEVIRPPRHIRQKIGNTGGVEIEEALSKADLALVHYSATFIREIEPELDKLRKAFSAAAKDPGNMKKYQHLMYDAAHEIRGQSGTFGYPLATLVADTVCKFLDPGREWSEEDLELLGLSVFALNGVFTHELKEDGGKLGRELALVLRNLRQNRLKVR